MEPTCRPGTRLCRPLDRRPVLPGRSTAVLAGVHVVADGHRAAVSAGLVIRGRRGQPAGRGAYPFPAMRTGQSRGAGVRTEHRPHRD
jgi:hypothetical protein